MRAPSSGHGLVLLLVALAGCHSPYYADRGALLGGVTGAVTGAAIGDRHGNAGPGAVVGGAVGAIAGGGLGAAVDADLARSQAIVEERLGRQLAGAVTVNDVVAMTQAGVGDDVIQTHIRAAGVARPPSTSEVIQLTRQGVSEPVIIAMQQTVTPASYVAAPPPRPVIVREYGPPPWPVVGPVCPPHARRPHFHRRPRVGVGMQFYR